MIDKDCSCGQTWLQGNKQYSTQDLLCLHLMGLMALMGLMET